MIEELKPGDSIVGIVKALNEFRGIKQTKVRVIDYIPGNVVRDGSVESDEITLRGGWFQ